MYLVAAVSIVMVIVVVIGAGLISIEVFRIFLFHSTLVQGLMNIHNSSGAKDQHTRTRILNIHVALSLGLFGMSRPSHQRKFGMGVLLMGNIAKRRAEANPTSPRREENNDQDLFISSDLLRQVFEVLQ